MPQATLSDVLVHLRCILGVQAASDRTDGELLDRFLAQHEDAAFAALVRRHGPMVLAVGRRILGDAHAAEDVFQATFLVLIRRARSIWKRKPLAGWLYAVARRIALRVRAQAAAQRILERRSQPMLVSQPLDELTWQELRGVLDEEIGALPEKYRATVVLCHLEGLSLERAAQQLGWSKSSLAKRLTKARSLLRGRLVRRGITLSAGALATVLSEKMAGAALGAMLTINLVKAAKCCVAGKTVAAGCVSAAAMAADQAVKTMVGSGVKLAILMMALSTVVIGGALAGYRAWAELGPVVQSEKARAATAINKAIGPAPKQRLPRRKPMATRYRTVPMLASERCDFGAATRMTWPLLPTARRLPRQEDWDPA